MDIQKHNRKAWDRAVDSADRWTVPINDDAIVTAGMGDWEIFLTPTKPVPSSWFPELNGLDILCLASGGGQQGPILAAAGGTVTVFDNSPKQLAQDRHVAERHDLRITTVEGDMADLSHFPDLSFDLIVHPVSNLFVPDIHPVWQDSFRVLRSGGALLAGFANPVIFLFDQELADSSGILQVKYALPYSDLADLPEADRQSLVDSRQPLSFGHTLDDQIGGQIEAGFVIYGFYEDAFAYEDGDHLSKYAPGFIATRAIKP